MMGLYLKGFMALMRSISQKIWQRRQRPFQDNNNFKPLNPLFGESRTLPMLPQPFPIIENSIAPKPSSFWSPELKNFPLPTNTAWLNFVLNQGSSPEYIHPYLIQVKDGKLTVCFPSRIVQPNFIIQSFVPDLTISTSNTTSGDKHLVSSFHDLGVTLKLPGHLLVPLVRGCPYITCIFNEVSNPRITTIHAVLNLSSNKNYTKHKLVMNNGQTWLIYSSLPLFLSRDLVIDGDFKGVVRIAFLPSTGAAEITLDRFSATYPLEGRADILSPFQVKYDWKRNNSDELLMLSLPIHREMMSFPSSDCIYPDLTYESIDGKMHAVVSNFWVLSQVPIHVGWYSSRGISDPHHREEVANALRQDISSLSVIKTNSTYFYGKALARVARLAIIAEEIGCLDEHKMAVDFLRDSITTWMEGSSNGNSFLYDSKWGGIISHNGSRDAGADFGLGIYNDHHYHMGYFCYAGAVLAKLDSTWGNAYKPHLYTIVEDFMTLSHPHDLLTDCQTRYPFPSSVTRSQQLFPKLRNFDFWVLHSWAGGLTEFADGRNQESTSEAINAYYSASLVGRAFGDSHLVDTALTLASFEIKAAQMMWHVPSSSQLYEANFISFNRIMGVLWANKRDTGLWFASSQYRECRVGIQVLPLMPITEFLFCDHKFVRELVEWTMPSLSRSDVKDGWKGFVYALQTIYNPKEALHNVLALTEHDDGNSLSNMLWWIFSR